MEPGDAEPSRPSLRARAVNPFTKGEIPLFLADYVLMGYGTGAIMAVPGEDAMSRAAAGPLTSTFAIWTLVGRNSAASDP